MSPPPDRREPGPRRRYWPPSHRERPPTLSPSFEPRCRRAGIQSALAPVVLPKVHQDVNERVPSRARGGERARMVPVGPHGTAATEHTVHGPGHPDREPAESEREGAARLGLNDEMYVIGLHRKLDDTEVATRRARERFLDDRRDSSQPERAEAPDSAQGRMHRMRCRVIGPRPVRHAGSSAGGALATCATPPATPCRARGKRKLHVACRHDWAIIPGRTFIVKPASLPASRQGEATGDTARVSAE